MTAEFYPIQRKLRGGIWIPGLNLCRLIFQGRTTKTWFIMQLMKSSLAEATYLIWTIVVSDYITADLLIPKPNASAVQQLQVH